MSNAICNICNGNGFITNEQGEYAPCSTCIPPDICDLPTKTAPRTHILDTANRLITGDRATTHGDAKVTFGKIAAHWSIYLNQKIEPQDVSNMMVLLKVVRAQESPRHKDNYVDQAGYAALGWEVS